jgi:hypothetical protein
MFYDELKTGVEDIHKGQGQDSAISASSTSYFENAPAASPTQEILTKAAYGKSDNLLLSCNTQESFFLIENRSLYD